LFTNCCAGVNQLFLEFAGLFTQGLSEKWKYLPSAPGRICRVRQILPGERTGAAIPAGTYFPTARKIDV
jgi:hypothetical protein